MQSSTFNDCFGLFLILKISSGFLWGMTNLGQPQNPRQPQPWAALSKQQLQFAHCCVSCLLINHCLFDDSIVDTCFLSFPCYSVQQPSPPPPPFHSQTTSQELKATTICCSFFNLSDISHYNTKAAADFIGIRPLHPKHPISHLEEFLQDFFPKHLLLFHISPYKNRTNIIVPITDSASIQIPIFIA